LKEFCFPNGIKVYSGSNPKEQDKRTSFIFTLNGIEEDNLNLNKSNTNDKGYLYCICIKVIEHLISVIIYIFILILIVRIY